MTEDVASMLITTPRLRMRPLGQGDVADLAAVGGNPRVARMIYVPTVPWPHDAVAAFIQSWRWSGALGYRLAITLPDGRFLGSLGVAKDREIFYFLDPQYWGKGYATEALEHFFADCFARFDIADLRADVFDDNPGSAKILTRLGFQKTGSGTGTSGARVEPAPISLYRLTRSDFEART